MPFRLTLALFGFITFIPLPCLSQFRDTSLFTLYSRPFFFNVLKSPDGEIYAGSSEGVYRMEGIAANKVDDRVGYLTLDERGRLKIDSNGIKYHNQQSFTHLLPFRDGNPIEYHSGTDDFFYITSGGRMHVYEILPYALEYRNHSVRCISRNFVGTYGGIYYKGVKLGQYFPNFTDGHIRELNGKAFICYSDLIIANLHGGDSLPTLQAVPEGFNWNYISDILYSKTSNRYFVATKKELGIMDRDLTIAKKVYSRNGDVGEVVLLGEDRRMVLFASGKELLAYSTTDARNETKAVLPEPILDAQITNFNYYLLCSGGLYVVRSDGRLQKLKELRKAHTILQLGSSDFAIATDVGLYLYNAASNRLSELIRGVEFNRRGLHLEGNRLYAGSINGLYIMEVGSLEKLAERTALVNRPQRLPAYVIPVFLALLLGAVVLSVLLYRSQRRLNLIIEGSGPAAAPKPSKLDIECFIRENLALASLKSISDRFQMKTSNVYTLLAPEKPGAFINRLRMEQVFKLRKEKKTAKEISKLTGFSESYIRKIWNPQALDMDGADPIET